MKKLILLLLIVGCASYTRQGDTFISPNPIKKINVEGVVDELSTRIEINTRSYDQYKPIGMALIVVNMNDPFFRAFIDKETKTKTLQLYVTLANLDWVHYDKATLKINGKIETIEAIQVGTDVDCDGGICNTYEDMVLTLERELLDEWAISGKTIRFGSSSVNTTQDVVVTSEEIKAFLLQVDKY